MDREKCVRRFRPNRQLYPLSIERFACELASGESLVFLNLIAAPIKMGVKSTLQNGPISAIEEEAKDLVLKHKRMPKFFPVGVPTYHTPPEHSAACLAAIKKYGRYE